MLLWGAHQRTVLVDLRGWRGGDRVRAGRKLGPCELVTRLGQREDPGGGRGARGAFW